MKKIIYISLLIIISLTALLGCSIKKQEPKPFTMTCINNNKTKNYEENITVTYKFNEEQLNTEYKIVTKTKFKNEKSYEIYKKEKEEIFNNNNSNNISYILEPNDEKKTYKLTMEVRQIVENTEEKDSNKIKASTILKSNEKTKAICKLKGITKNDIKN